MAGSKSDRKINANRIALSSLLACSTVHHHLVNKEKRTQIGIILESGEAREVHHHCLLIGYGADAINPYLAFDVLTKSLNDGAIKDKSLKNTKDLALLKIIISSADIYIQNLAPGAAERAGLGSKYMRASNKKLITCDISGYGQTGPYRDMKAYDLLVQAETGLCSVTGTAEEEGRVGVSVCDVACGMNAHSSILQALYNREKTGEGSAIEVSLFDGMADWMNVPYLQTVYGSRSVERVGLSHPSIAPYGAYMTKCGKKILISIQNEREWIQLCSSVLMLKDLSKDERFNKPTYRVKNRTALDQIIADEFIKYNKDILLERLRKERIACGRRWSSVRDVTGNDGYERTVVGFTWSIICGVLSEYG